MQKRFEILLRGFNGRDCATDHLVIWLATDLSAAELVQLLQAKELMSEGGTGPVVCADELPPSYPFDFSLPAEIDGLASAIPALLSESKEIFNRGCHYAGGLGAFREGEPRILPSYFTKPKCANAKAWFAGWDHDGRYGRIKAPSSAAETGRNHVAK